VTPGEGGCIHRFFDTSPISPSGSLLAVCRLPFESRLPAPGDKAQIVVIDLNTGEERVVAETAGWETQMGANINWGGSDEELFFNDVDTETWEPFAWKLDPGSGKRVRMGGPVYHASPDGRWLIAANMTTMRRTQPGYGVIVPDSSARHNVGLSEDDGFTLTDAHTGESRLLVSIRELVDRADPAVEPFDWDRYEVYGFHSKFNPQGDLLMVSLRWYPKSGAAEFNAFKRAHDEVRFAWFVLDLEKESISCAVGPEQWVKRGHHATWFPDGRRISMNLNIDREEHLRFVQVNSDGSDLRKMRNDVWGSGHPTVHPDGVHLVTDTYTTETPIAFGDGTIPIRWIDLRTGGEQTIIRINTAQPHSESPLRVDPHPAWDRSWRYLTINGFVGGTRRVFVADMASLLKGE
jgi:hypothetical protein